MIKGVKVLAAQVRRHGSRSSFARWRIRFATNGRAAWWCWRPRRIPTSRSSRRHQGSHVESACRQTGRRGGPGRRRQGRRTSGYGRSRRQGIQRRCRRRWQNVYTTVEGMLLTWRSRRRHRWRRTHRSGLRHRAEAARLNAVIYRKGLRRQFALPLPDEHGVLHHAGAARNRRHSDDLAQRKARPHRSAEILPPRGGTLQARHPSI